VFDQTCFSFLIYDPIIAQGQLQGRVLFRATKKWICQLSTSLAGASAVENRGQRRVFSLSGVPLFVFFQSLIGFLGAVTVGMKTAVEEGAGKKLIKFG